MRNHEQQSVPKENWQYRFANAEEIKAYCALRLKSYFEAYGDDKVTMNEYDIPGNVVVASNHGEIFGGMRLVILPAYSKEHLPLENYGFDLKVLAPQIKEHKCCEVDKLCVASEMRGKFISKNLMAVALSKAQAAGCDYIFSLFNPSLIHYYQRLFNELGYNATPTVHKQILQTANNSTELTLAKISLKKIKT